MPRFIQEMQLKELMLRKESIQLAALAQCKSSRQSYQCPSPHPKNCKMKFEQDIDLTINAITLLRNQLWAVICLCDRNFN